jgi:hypothetical protein
MLAAIARGSGAEPATHRPQPLEGGGGRRIKQENER